MRRSSIVTLTLGVSVALAACSSNDNTPSRVIAPQQPSAVASTSACNFSTMRSDAKTALSNQDVSLSIITDMSQQYGKQNFTASDLDGWSLLKIVAHERLTSAQGGTSTQLAAYVVDILNCITTTAPSAPSFNGFAANGATVLSSGLFEVRGDGSTQLPAWGWISLNSQRTPASPFWGVEAIGGTWPAGNPAYLAFAYPTTVGTFIPSAATIDGNLPNSTYNAFEVALLPDNFPSKSSLFRVGVCVSSFVSGVANRIVHAGTILLNSPPQALCTSPTVASASTGFKQWLASFLTPNLAWAAVSGLTGGTPDGWSPMSTGAITVSQVALPFTTQPPPTTFVDTSFTVVVRATFTGTDNSTKGIPGVDVTLQVANNSGTPAGAFINGGNPTFTTGPDGYVSFTISVHKAGGYTLLATGSLDGAATQSGLSTQFQVQNK